MSLCHSVTLALWHSDRVTAGDRRCRPVTVRVDSNVLDGRVEKLHSKKVALKIGLKPMLTMVSNESGALNPNRSRPLEKITLKKIYTQSPGRCEHQNVMTLEHFSTKSALTV